MTHGQQQMQQLLPTDHILAPRPHQINGSNRRSRQAAYRGRNDNEPPGSYTRRAEVKACCIARAAKEINEHFLSRMLLLRERVT